MYRRTTSYIYSYENGQKICSCGFCRFDTGDNQCKIFISVKVPDRYTMGVAEIYILVQEEADQKITRKMLGKTGGLNGSICYRQICEKDHMAGNIGMDSIKGVLIYNGESLKKVFYCNLKGEEPNILSLEEETEDKNMYDNENDNAYREEDSNNNIGNNNTDVRMADINMIDINRADININIKGAENTDSDASSYTDSKTGNSTDNISADNSCNTVNNADCNVCEDNDDISGSTNAVSEKQLEYTDIVDWEHNRTEKENSKKNNNEKNVIMEDKWQELLFSKFPKVRISFGGEESEAIKMRPHDLVWFPRKYWRFSNNRCLLNGYYNYRYIMLVKGIGDREGNYYLAVPGKNMVNEAISARKQGFSEFVRSKGDLGFWCCKVGQ